MDQQQSTAVSQFGRNLANERVPSGWCYPHSSEPVLLVDEQKGLPYSYGALAFPENVHLTVGPVIGTVTSTSARYLYISIYRSK